MLGVALATLGRNTAFALGAGSLWVAVIEGVIRGNVPSWGQYLWGENIAIVVEWAQMENVEFTRGPVLALTTVVLYTAVLVAARDADVPPPRHRRRRPDDVLRAGRPPPGYIHRRGSGLSQHRLRHRRWDGFTPRPGDVFVCTPPKCGTTWMQTIVASLLWPAGDVPGPVLAISPWIDDDHADARCTPCSRRRRTGASSRATPRPTASRGSTTRATSSSRATAATPSCRSATTSNIPRRVCASR